MSAHPEITILNILNWGIPSSDTRIILQYPYDSGSLPIRFANGTVDKLHREVGLELVLDETSSQGGLWPYQEYSHGRSIYDSKDVREHHDKEQYSDV